MGDVEDRAAGLHVPGFWTWPPNGEDPATAVPDGLHHDLPRPELWRPSGSGRSVTYPDRTSPCWQFELRCFPLYNYPYGDAANAAGMHVTSGLGWSNYGFSMGRTTGAHNACDLYTPYDPADPGRDWAVGIRAPVDGVVLQTSVGAHEREDWDAADLPRGLHMDSLRALRHSERVGGRMLEFGEHGKGGNHLRLLTRIGTIASDGAYRSRDGEVFVELYFAHMRDAPLVSEGQFVYAGTPLGVMGRTGATQAIGSATHLHFQVEVCAIGVGRELTGRWRRQRFPANVRLINPHRGLLLSRDPARAGDPFSHPADAHSAPVTSGGVPSWAEELLRRPPWWDPERDLHPNGAPASGDRLQPDPWPYKLRLPGAAGGDDSGGAAAPSEGAATEDGETAQLEHHEEGTETAFDAEPNRLTRIALNQPGYERDAEPAGAPAEGGEGAA